MIDTVWEYVVTHTWVAEVFLIVLGTATAHLFARLAFNRLESRFSKTHNLYDDALLDAVRRPLGYAIWVLGVAWAAQVTAEVADSELLSYVDDAREVAVIWLLVWFAVRFIRFLEERLSDASYRGAGGSNHRFRRG